MKGTRRWPLYLATALAAGATVRSMLNRRVRRELRRRGLVRDVRSVWYTVGNLRIHAKTAGDDRKPVLVLIHGWGISSSYFIPCAERLAGSFHVYAPDLPGHGLSDRTPSPLDVSGLTEALLDWMDAAGIHHAILVGHSMGCQIAVEAALRARERVDGIVLIGLTPEPTARSTAQQFYRFLAGGLFERASLNKLLLKDYFRMGSRLRPEFNAMRFDPIEHKLPLVTVPSILVRGEHDTIVSQDWFDRAARLLRTDATIVIPWWGHAVMYSAADALVKELVPRLTAIAKAYEENSRAVPKGIRSGV